MKLAPKSFRSWNVHKCLTVALQSLIVIGVGLSIYEQQWLNAVVITGILLLTLVPGVLGRGLDVYVPAEFELLTIAFIFAAMFLGETRDFYARFWWWDIALHATSGGLLGIFGVLLVYILNHDARIDLHMQPGFVAFFAYCFAATVGTLWEVFEFAMDQLFAMNMQKPMFDDPSGLTDTMWDLIVNSLGALAVSIAGYIYMKRRIESVVERWIHRFITRNHRLFRR